jgi:hypothetical protein
MKIKVEACSGSDHYYRLNIPHNGRVCREFVKGETWGRREATEALDMLEALYHLNRRSVRFDHC